MHFFRQEFALFGGGSAVDGLAAVDGLGDLVSSSVVGRTLISYK